MTIPSCLRVRDAERVSMRAMMLPQLVQGVLCDVVALFLRVQRGSSSLPCKRHSFLDQSLTFVVCVV
jgi:hypothetical protein